MAINPYYQHLTFTNSNEQNLYNDLIIESIRNYGMDVYYIPRTNDKLDLLFGEDVLSKFESSHLIEMYFESVDGFAGDRNFLSKFGLEIRKQANFIVSKDRFSEEVQTEPDVPVRPREGDLIWMPLTRDLFEITFADHEAIFWQLGKVYVWRLLVEKFKYSSERINTGIDEIDTIGLDKALVEGPTMTLRLDAGGWAYTRPPVVTISGGGGSNATATATINGNGNVTGLVMTSQGSGYTSAPTVTITRAPAETTPVVLPADTTGHGAKATAILDNTLDTPDKLADNTRIQTGADAILDFNERDPFSGGRF
jgi:hypothetical protein